MNQKKILFIINNFGVGGAERLIVDDINEMLARGIDVFVITLKKEFSTSLESQCHLGDNKKIHIIFKTFTSLHSWILLYKTVKQIKPDLVISHLWFANSTSRIICLFLRIKKIICFEQNVYDSIKTKKMFFVDFVLQFFCRKIIAVSETVKKSLIRHGIQEKRISVIYNSIDIDVYTSAENIRGSLAEHNNVLFLFIGRLIHQKGVDILIRAFENVSNASLLIVGQGPEKIILKEMVEERGMENKVIFLGVRSDIPNLLASVDCFVFPSRHEGFSLVLLEAMASGLPIIITDFPSGLEVIRHDKNGLVSPVDNISLLTRAMNNIVDSEELRTRLGSQAKKDVASFSIKKHVDSILNFLS